MPLTKRAVSPVNVSLHRLPASMQTDELECVANGTLASLVRQLSSLSRHAEHIFGEIYHEAVKVDHRTNTMAQRIERLTHKVTQLDCNQEQVSLEDLHMRKPFKSSTLIDQHTLDRQGLPSALSDRYQACDRPPNLDALNPYRDDKKSALKYYTDPSYFFDLWREEMLKEMGDGRRGKAVKSPTDNNRSPSRKKRGRQGAGLDAGSKAFNKEPLSSRYMAATQQRPSDMMHFPAEYQAPQIVRTEQVQAPIGMSVPTSNGYTPIQNTLSPAINVPSPIPEEAPMPSSKALGHQLAHLELEEDPLLDDDDLPPPPPPLMHTSLVCQMPQPPTMQFVAPSEEQMAPPPPPPPPPPAPISVSNQPIGSFAIQKETTIATTTAVTKTSNEEKTAEKPQEMTNRSNLLAEIQSGIKLKQVQRKEQMAEEKAAAEANDVAAILRRRMEHVLGNSDSNTESDDDEEWD